MVGVLSKRGCTRVDVRSWYGVGSWMVWWPVGLNARVRVRARVTWLGVWFGRLEADDGRTYVRVCVMGG